MKGNTEYGKGVGPVTVIKDAYTQNCQNWPFGEILEPQKLSVLQKQWTISGRKNFSTTLKSKSSVCLSTTL